MSEKTGVNKEQLAANLELRKAAREKAEEAKLKRGYRKAHTGFANTIEWENPGQIFEGTYRKMKQSVGTYDSNIYILQREEEYYALWGSTQIDQAFADIPLCSEVFIEFIGVDKIEGTKKEVKVFQILYKEPKYSHEQEDNTGIDYKKNRADKRVSF